MKKFSIFAAFSGVAALFSGVAHGAYPVANGYQAGAYRANGYPVATPQMAYVPTVASNGMVVSNVNPMQAANPNTRVTGALPRVGTSASTAGRQYYQPSDYDRLADSGLYVGLSAAYSASVMGHISADYTNDPDAFAAPGAFQNADFNTDTVIPLQISVGAAINNDIRVDFSYSRYSKLGYPDSVQTADGDGGFTDAAVDGGAITANATMLNVYYNIDSYTGYLAGGVLRPYIGAGVGISLNTIADYVVFDDSYYYVEEDLTVVPEGILTGISDIYAYHNGGTNENLAFMLEGGVTTELDGGLKLDFYVRYANLGKVKTSGSVVVSQTEWLSDGTGGPAAGSTTSGEYQAPYDSVFHYTNWTESGRLSTVDVGLRLRLQF